MRILSTPSCLSAPVFLSLRRFPSVLQTTHAALNAAFGCDGDLRRVSARSAFSSELALSRLLLLCWQLQLRSFVRFQTVPTFNHSLSMISGDYEASVTLSLCALTDNRLWQDLTACVRLILGSPRHQHRSILTRSGCDFGPSQA